MNSANGYNRLLTSLSIGQVPVEFEFINKLEEQSYCQPWLKITPFKSVITPGNCLSWKSYMKSLESIKNGGNGILLERKNDNMHFLINLKESINLVKWPRRVKLTSSWHPVPGCSCEIRLEVLVDKSCVATLDASNHVLDDILVLHLTGGKDFFVSFCFYFKRVERLLASL